MGVQVKEASFPKGGAINGRGIADRPLPFAGLNGKKERRVGGLRPGPLWWAEEGVEQTGPRWGGTSWVFGSTPPPPSLIWASTERSPTGQFSGRCVRPEVHALRSANPLLTPMRKAGYSEERAKPPDSAGKRFYGIGFQPTGVPMAGTLSRSDNGTRCCSAASCESPSMRTGFRCRYATQTACASCRGFKTPATVLSAARTGFRAAHS